jgi:lysophospholipase L1-like esterase
MNLATLALAAQAAAPPPGFRGPSGTDADAMLLGALLVILPLLLGWTMGWALRPLIQALSGWKRSVAAVLPAIVPLTIAMPAAGAIPTIGSWDVVMVFFWVSLGVLLSSLHCPGVSSRAALVVIPLLTLGALEFLCRVALPATRPYPPAHEARLVVSFSSRDPPCEAIFPATTGFLEARSDGLTDRDRMVVHVGDSMVWGNGVERDEAFPAQLARLQPEVAHVNSGSPAAGPDADLIIARHWVEHARVALVAVYFFMGNDVQDINRAYTCCGLGPLLDWEGAEPRPRCDHLEWTFPPGVLLSGSPPPYPLRVSAGWSSFAAHATSSFDNVNSWILSEKLFNANFGDWDELPMEQRFARGERIFRALRDDLAGAKVPFLLVVLPFRQTLELAYGLEPSGIDVWNGLEHGRAGHQRVVEIARGLGIDVLDAWELFHGAIGREGVEKWFAQDYPGDGHFSPAGHVLLANWLLPQLERRGIRSQAPPSSATAQR